MDAARVEVLHREVVLALHHADHAERVGKVGVLGDRTLDQEPATFQPLVGGPPANHPVFDHRVGHLDRPLADQRLERLQLPHGVGFVHSTPSFVFSRDIDLSLPAIGGPLVDQHEHAVADDLRLLQPQVASIGLLLEDLLARPEDHREDHQVDLVDEVALDQLLHQSVAPRHLQLAVELLLQLAHLGRRVAAVEDRRVVPLGVLERRRDDELRHRVELLGELALALRPGAGEALIGSQPYLQGVCLPRLVQLELIPFVSAVELEGPTRVLESRLAPWRLHDAVERYELRHHDPCCHQSISFTPTRRLQTPADSRASPFTNSTSRCCSLAAHTRSWVQSLVGHASTTITLDRYSHWIPSTSCRRRDGRGVGLRNLLWLFASSPRRCERLPPVHLGVSESWEQGANWGALFAFHREESPSRWLPPGCGSDPWWLPRVLRVPGWYPLRCTRLGYRPASRS